MARNIGNFVLFQVLWFAAVVGAAKGFSWLAFPVLACMFGWAAFTGARTRDDVLLAAAGLGVGMLFEILFLSTGLIRYQEQVLAWAPPMWILALWIGFAMSFNHSMAWLQNRWLACVALGAFGSASSLYAGISFGAAQANAPMWAVSMVYGFSWALLVPVLAWVAWYLQRRAPEQALS
ncbi:MAG: DUF2878 domain-containing protein [Alcanivoracaceae bacterium]